MGVQILNRKRLEKLSMKSSKMGKSPMKEYHVSKYVNNLYHVKMVLKVQTPEQSPKVYEEPVTIGPSFQSEDVKPLKHEQ